MRISVASVGLNPLLPKNPATNLPARSFRGLIFMFFLSSFPLFPTGKEKLARQWPASHQRVPLVNLRVCSLSSPSEKWPCASRPRREMFQLILPYSSDGAGWKVAAPLDLLVLPLLPHLTGSGHPGISLPH